MGTPRIEVGRAGRAWPRAEVGFGFGVVKLLLFLGCCWSAASLVKKVGYDRTAIVTNVPDRYDAYSIQRLNAVWLYRNSTVCLYKYDETY